MVEAGINAAIDAFLNSQDSEGAAEHVKRNLMAARSDDEDIAVGEGSEGDGFAGEPGPDEERPEPHHGGGGGRGGGGGGGGGFGGLFGSLIHSLTGGGGLASILQAILSAIAGMSGSQRDGMLQSFAEKTVASDNKNILETIVNHFAGNANNSVLISFIEKLLSVKKQSAPEDQGTEIDSTISKLSSDPEAPELPGQIKSALIG